MDYYNEFDAYPAQWLRNLQAAGHIPQGRVDERSIADVRAEDLEGVRSAHFFAGVGGWPLALRLAGFPEDQEVWTGSCPCQPFSVAGARKGTADKRHLWPEFLRLIGQRRPPIIFGEQVASADGRKWLAGVRTDLEGLGYAVGAADLCAAGTGEEGEGWFLRGGSVSLEPTLIGAPHIRQRLYWVAYAKRDSGGTWRPREGSGSGNGSKEAGASVEFGRRRNAGRLEFTAIDGSESRAQLQREHDREVASDGRESSRMGDSNSPEFQTRDVFQGRAEARSKLPSQSGASNKPNEMARRMADLEADRRRQIGSNGRGGAGGTEAERRPARSGLRGASFWRTFDVLPCADGKARRVESGTFPLAHGVPARVGKLRAYGNAIVPQVAAEFIKAYLEVRTT